MSVCIKLMGGLGNQCFQWALGFALQQKGYQVEYDTSAYVNNAHRGYWLPRLVGNLLLGDHSYHEFCEGSHIFHPMALTPSNGSKMVGYWQTEQYFSNYADAIRSHVNFHWMQNPLTGVAQEIEQEIYRNSSVFLHVRRQDYVHLQHFHGLLSIEYYREALKVIRQKRNDVKVFVFSDDQVWCQQWFPKDFHFVTGTNMWEDIRLMAGCKDAVMANSSFSWWSAWFGDNQLSRTVIAPKQWFTGDVDDRDLVPSRWIRI